MELSFVFSKELLDIHGGYLLKLSEFWDRSLGLFSAPILSLSSCLIKLLGTNIQCLRYPTRFKISTWYNVSGNFFYGSLGIGFAACRNICKGKPAYISISYIGTHTGSSSSCILILSFDLNNVIQLLDEIAEKFYGVKRKNPMQGMLGDIFKVIL